MRVLVIGATGQVGRLVAGAFRGHDVRGTGSRDLDVRDRPAVARAVAEFDPQAVVLAAALANADACEDRPGDAYALNVDGARNAALASRGRAFVFFSTDHVFDGRGGPYSEEDVPDPLNVYGRTKIEAERVVRTVHPASLVVRTTLVFNRDPAGRNFFCKLMAARDPVPCWTDHLANYTYGPNLADAIVELVTSRKTGLWNVAGPECMNRHEFALRVARRFGLDASLFRPVSIREAPPRAPRPLQAGLRIDKARAALQTRLLGVDEALDFEARSLPP